MPTDHALIAELSAQYGETFLPLEDEDPGWECYKDDCHEIAVCRVPVDTTPWRTPEKRQVSYIQECEGHARLHLDKEYQELRLRWRLNGWGE